MRRRPTDDELRDELARVFEAFEQWKALDRETQLQAFGCHSCKVRVGEPCRGRNGAHAPRQDAVIAALNSAPVEGWRRDLEEGAAPLVVLQKVRRSKLYRAGKLTALLQPRRAPNMDMKTYAPGEVLTDDHPVTVNESTRND